MASRLGNIETGKRVIAPEEKAQLQEQVKCRAKAVEEQCTFEAFGQSQTRYAPMGGALVVLSFAMLHFGALVPFGFGKDGHAIGQLLDEFVAIVSKDLIKTDYAQTHVVAMLLFVIFLAIGLFLLHKADRQKEEFRKTHPYVAGHADKAVIVNASKKGRQSAVVGIVLTMGSVTVYALSRIASPHDGAYGISSIFDPQATALSNVLDEFSFVVLAGAVWFIMRGIRISSAPSHLAYNIEALVGMSIYEVAEERAVPNHAVRLVAKDILDKALARGRAFLAICLVIALVLFALPIVSLPVWWIPLVAGLVGRDAFVAHGVARCKRELAPLLQ